MCHVVGESYEEAVIFMRHMPSSQGMFIYNTKKTARFIVAHHELVLTVWGSGEMRRRGTQMP